MYHQINVSPDDCKIQEKLSSILNVWVLVIVSTMKCIIMICALYSLTHTHYNSNSSIHNSKEHKRAHANDAIIFNKGKI